jgi:hypothetical protein
MATMIQIRVQDVSEAAWLNGYFTLGIFPSLTIYGLMDLVGANYCPGLKGKSASDIRIVKRGMPFSENPYIYDIKSSVIRFFPKISIPSRNLQTDITFDIINLPKEKSNLGIKIYFVAFVLLNDTE